MPAIKTLFLETRPQFLLLSVVLAFLGNTVAWHDGHFHIGHALLAGFGLVLTHISVNTLNDYFDYRSKIDLKTQCTPFSGGSGLLPGGLLKSSQVLWLGTGSLIVAAGIGVYFIAVKGLLLLPLLIVAVICVVLYTPLILRTPAPEWAAGLGLGFLPVMGLYFAQAGTYTWHAVIASVPSGILVYNLLLLNEFPDVEADATGGRKTLPIVAGKGGASAAYISMTLLMYLWITGWAAAGVLPLFTLIALLTLPLAFKAIQGARQYNDMGRLVPAMGSNVMVVLVTQLLLGIGYILAAAF
jgi:1,4-dihydroxy-2-naphthoate octaprenyltransferase